MSVTSCPTLTVWFDPAFAVGLRFDAVAAMMTLSVGLINAPSRTLSCTTKLPAASGAKVGFTAVGFVSAAVLPVGREANDQL